MTPAMTPATTATSQHVADERFDAVVIGGGFYGCAIAGFLARRGWRVAVVERERQLMARASYVNQARLHNGYHYPRSYRTAVRSRVNLPTFKEVFPEAVFDRFRALYCIARHGSKVSPAHFERFCRMAGMPIAPAAKQDAGLFDSRLIDRVYEVEEPAFNAEILRQRQLDDMANLPVTVMTGTAVDDISARADDRPVATLSNGMQLEAGWLFNCTYANLNSIYRGQRRAGSAPNAPADKFGLVHQIAELVLLEPPEEIAGRGVTVMDGPFFSTMPFPARGLHSLTHVRYTHHMKWREDEDAPLGMAEQPPMAVLARYLETGGGKLGRSRFAWMLRDSSRYLPALNNARFADTLMDVKTLAVGTKVDDARPILFHRDRAIPRLVSVLGGKVDNIFDVFSFLDETLDGLSLPTQVAGGIGAAAAIPGGIAERPASDSAGA